MTLPTNQTPEKNAPLWSAQTMPDAAPATPESTNNASVNNVLANKPLKPAKKQDRTTLALLLVAALVAVGGVGFALGHVTANTASPAAANARPSGRFNLPSLAPGQTFDLSQFGGAGRVGGAANLSGTVQAINGSTLTLQEANGTTVTIDLSGTTTYHGETPATQSQINVGTGVTVQLDTGASASGVPTSPRPSGAQTLTAKAVLITTP